LLHNYYLPNQETRHVVEKEVRQAISELESYSDRELSNIVIVRCNIESIVRNGRTDTVAASNNMDLNEHQPLAA
jgi:hypothetical protein